MGRTDHMSRDGRTASRGDVLLAWANDRHGRRISVAALDPARRRARAPFTCIGCGEPLVARLGSRRARHFAHRPGSTCPLTHPESALHLNAKERLLFLCAEAFAHRLRVSLGARCPGCRRTLAVDLAEMGDAAVVEGTIGALRADVLVTRSGAPALALEVLVSHAVDPAKEASLRAASVPALEIDAREPWEEPGEGCVTLRIARSIGTPRCGACDATSRADADRARGGEPAAIAELEAYRARGLMGAPPGPAASSSSPLSAEERASVSRSFSCPECGGAALIAGERLVQHACGGGLRPVAWRGYDGTFVELSWWRAPPRRR